MKRLFLAPEAAGRPMAERDARAEARHRLGSARSGVAKADWISAKREVHPCEEHESPDDGYSR